MKFLYPQYLFLLIPLVLLFGYLKKRAKGCGINPKLVIKRVKTDEKLLILVAALILLALARPVIVSSMAESSAKKPIFIAIDVSNSMMAEDVKPNRFEKAKKLAGKLIKKSDRAALIAFSTNPLLIAPPTNDREILYQALELIEPKNILTKGTDFQKLLNFVSRFEGEKELVVISDGGDFKNLEIPNDINLYAIAVGSKSGALIPTGDGYLKSGGKMVVTKINPAFLKAAKAYAINDIGNILKHIQTEKSRNSKARYLELSFIPLLLALVLILFIYTTIFDNFKKFLPLVLALNLNASIIDEFNLLQGYDQFKQKNFKKALRHFDEKSLQSAYAKAVTLMRLGRYVDAVKILKKLRSKDRVTKSKILYSLALSYERLRRYDKARKYYIKSMQLYPDMKTLNKIASLAFYKNPKKPLLPFAKQKMVNSKRNSKKSGGKNSKSSNLNISAGAGTRGDKKSKSASINRSKAMPFGSKVYELINKGYVDEKRPW